MHQYPQNQAQWCNKTKGLSNLVIASHQRIAESRQWMAESRQRMDARMLRIGNINKIGFRVDGEMKLYFLLI